MACGRVFGTKISLHAAVDMHSRQKKKKNRVTHRLPSAGRPRCFLNSNRSDRLGNKNEKKSLAIGKSYARRTSRQSSGRTAACQGASGRKPG